MITLTILVLNAINKTKNEPYMWKNLSNYY